MGVESNLTSIDSVSSSAPHSLQSTGDDKIDNTDQSDSNRSSSNPLSSSSNQSGSELICLDESTTSQMDFGGITLDNFELDGFNDDDFDPRAEEASRSVLSSAPSTAPAILVASPTFPPPALPPRGQELSMKKTSPIPLAMENNNNPFNNPFNNTPPTNNSSSDPFGMATF